MSTRTLERLKAEGHLKEKRHWIRKNPMTHRGHLLWHQQRVEMALGSV